MNPSPCVDKAHIPHKIAFPCIAPLGFDPRTFGLWAQHASSAPRSTCFQSGNVKFKYCYVFIVLPEDLSMKVGSNADLIKSLATRHSGRWFWDGVEWKCQIVVWYGTITWQFYCVLMWRFRWPTTWLCLLLRRQPKNFFYTLGPRLTWLWWCQLVRGWEMKEESD